MRNSEKKQCPCGKERIHGVNRHVSAYLIKIILVAFIMLMWPKGVAEAFGAARERRVAVAVVDSVTGEPLPFANVLSEKRPSANVVADEEGVVRLPVTGGMLGWKVSYTGYEPKPFSYSVADTAVTVRLAPVSKNLKEVIVRPGKVRYSKKNNPAVEFVRRIRGQSDDHNPLREPYYSYDKYEKTLLAMNDFNGDFSSGFLSKQGKFLSNYVDTSSWTGKRILNLIMKEKASTRITGKSPHVDKEITRGYKSAGMDEVLSQENIQVILEDAIKEVDIFGNDVVILQNRFVSPLSKIGPDFYKYYLTDTVYVGEEKCVELSFVPHNAETMGFNGKIYVPVGDTTMFVKKVTMRTPHDINLNYVDNLFINQSFEKDTLGNRHKVYDDVCIEMRIMPGTPGLYGRKTTLYDKFSYDRREDLADYYDRLGRYFSLDESNRRQGDFWDAERMIPLTAAETRMGGMTREMRKVPLFYWGEKALSLMESGYVRTGNPSKIDIGPLNTLVSFGSVEGVRLRLGAMTMSPLNDRLFAKGFVAYGTKDRKWKYSGHLEYSFVPKKNHSYEWPRHAVYASYAYDLDMLGQHYLFTSQDNIFLSLKRKESILVTYQKLGKLGYVLELPNNFSVEAGFRYDEQEATRWVPFRFADGRQDRSFRQSSFNVTVRWAPGEKFVQGRTLRLPVNMDAWILQFTHEFGPKGFLGSAFTVNRSELSVQKRLWLSAFGYTDIILKAGKVWSSVYYPMLMWPNANLSYTIQPESYSLMNAMEFANDKYVALDFTYFGNGILFNRLPLLKKLKLREAVTFKGLMGGLSDRNNPLKNPRIYQFPADAHPINKWHNKRSEIK